MTESTDLNRIGLPPVHRIWRQRRWLASIPKASAADVGAAVGLEVPVPRPERFAGRSAVDRPAAVQR